MKKLMTIGAACYMLTMFSSCGTFNSLFTHGKSSVFLMQSPADVEVACNGVKLDKSKEVFAAKSRTSHGGVYNTTTTTSYYATAFKLPSKKKATIELYSPSANKRATVELKPHANRNIIWADILLTGSIGLFIDIPTGNLKFLSPRLIDVESALAGKPRKEWLSQGKMKRMAKRGADKAAKKKY
jgi:hypothetical protein